MKKKIIQEDIQKLTKKLRRLNPNVKIRFEKNTSYAIIIARCPSCNKLNLPDGYELNLKNQLTKKQDTNSDIYEYIELITESEYLLTIA